MKEAIVELYKMTGIGLGEIMLNQHLILSALKGLMSEEQRKAFEVFEAKEESDLKKLQNDLFEEGSKQ